MDQISYPTKNSGLNRSFLLKLLTKTIISVRIVDVVPVHVHLAIVGVPIHVRHVAVRIARAQSSCEYSSLAPSLCFQSLCVIPCSLQALCCIIQFLNYLMHKYSQAVLGCGKLSFNTVYQISLTAFFSIKNTLHVRKRTRSVNPNFLERVKEKKKRESYETA